MTMSDRPEATASSTTYWIVGLSTRGSISLGWALVAGRKRVPRPAAGNTPLRTFIDDSLKSASGGGEQCHALAIERVPDPSPQLGLRVEAPGGVDLHGQAEDDLTAGDLHDTVRDRRFQRGARLPPPGLGHVSEYRERAVDVGLARHGHVDGRLPPSGRQVDEVGHQ